MSQKQEYLAERQSDAGEESVDLEVAVLRFGQTIEQWRHKPQTEGIGRITTFSVYVGGQKSDLYADGRWRDELPPRKNIWQPLPVEEDQANIQKAIASDEPDDVPIVAVVQGEQNEEKTAASDKHQRVSEESRVRFLIKHVALFQVLR